MARPTALALALTVLLALLAGTCTARITEEELITVTQNSAVVTWRTLRPQDSAIDLIECTPSQASTLLAAADLHHAAWMSAVDDGSEVFGTLKTLVSGLPDSESGLEEALHKNIPWLKSFLGTPRDAAVSTLANLVVPGAQSLEEDIRAIFAQARRVYAETAETSYHYARLEGLTPGTTYCYQVSSGGETGSPTRWSPGTFTTLLPPPGDLLFSFATVNDMHVGEEVAGLIVIGGITLTPGFSWPDPENPYWKFTNEAAIKGINDLGVDFTIAKGDVSSDYKEHEYEEVKRILGGLQNPYYVMRGNHDRVGSGPDYYKQVFGLNTTWYSFDHKGFHFVALDSVQLSDGAPAISDEQFAFLEEDLASHNSSKTFVFLHHAITLEAFIWSLDSEDRDQFITLVSNNPQVVGVFSGHSHRAKLTQDRTLPELVFAETPSTKEYPMGFSHYQIYTGGYIQTFQRSYCVECLEWNSITRQEFFRLAPFFLYGKLADRNFVVTF